MKRIMIVDDDKTMQTVYQDIFQACEQQYSAAFFYDALNAFKSLKKEKFDLIITDIIMDPIDGETFYAMIRNVEELENIPILLVTVLEKSELVQHLKGSQTLFLRKPFIAEELIDKIQAILS
jgi:twitching motility two-component system response regulator PilG